MIADVSQFRICLTRTFNGLKMCDVDGVVGISEVRHQEVSLFAPQCLFARSQGLSSAVTPHTIPKSCLLRVKSNALASIGAGKLQMTIEGSKSTQGIRRREREVEAARGDSRALKVLALQIFLSRKYTVSPLQ
jgi:hypothetical protein